MAVGGEILELGQVVGSSGGRWTKLLTCHVSHAHTHAHALFYVVASIYIKYMYFHTYICTYKYVFLFSFFFCVFFEHVYPALNEKCWGHKKLA